MELPTNAQHQAMGYDRTATMFSPEGHLLQVEYAEKAVRLGSSSIGVVCKNGVFILADKRIVDKLIVPSSSNKIHEIDSHIITSVAGILSDARVLIEKSQILSQQNTLTYDTPIEPETIISEISKMQQQFTQYGGARPFGVSIMLAGLNNDKPRLFQSNITGNYLEYFANAIGENDDEIKKELRKQYKKDMEIKQGVKMTLEILKKIQAENFELNRLELVYLTVDKKKLTRLEGKEIQEFIK
jgi:proteasome alpha subunit